MERACAAPEPPLLLTRRDALADAAMAATESAMARSLVTSMARSSCDAAGGPLAKASCRSLRLSTSLCPKTASECLRPLYIRARA